MSFTGRIRFVLIGVALLPPILMMIVVYFYSSQQEEIRYQQYATEDVQKLATYSEQFNRRLSRNLTEAVATGWYDRSVRLTKRGRASQIKFNDLTAFGFDFCELIDSTGRIVASAHRPGLIGEQIALDAWGDSLIETVEYDIGGRHAALTGMREGASAYRIMAGRYLSSEFLGAATLLIRGELSTRFAEAGSTEQVEVGAWNRFALYRSDSSLDALVSRPGERPYYLVAEFVPPERSALFRSFVDSISFVALLSVMAAVGLGIYISSRARREFNNLIEAFGRVARGDLDTTVMAYSEGEFSRLADSFSAMTHKLRRSQQQLATSEKIAAWQTMARKIAHEIKNPLTPIAISADDLRRSHAEQLPGFDETLDKSTRMIKTEVDRLTRLLDEFVSFARMRPAEPKPTRLTELVSELSVLYRSEIESVRVRIDNQSSRDNVRLDPEAFKQVLVNLIKNGLEAGDAGLVTLVIRSRAHDLVFEVSDSGPGFSENILARQFEPYLSTKKAGTGLGLVICQRIVNDHGGRIELKNDTKGGAVVTITLPQN